MPQTTRRRKYTTTKKRKLRPVIEPRRNYNRRESGDACDCHWVTVMRAYESGHLKGYRIGSRILHSGQHLLDWLESGGQTGRTIEDVKREMQKKGEAIEVR